MTGAVIDKAIELAEVDNPRDNDTRSPAERRGEALADVCSFYVDYHNRVSADPDADAPVVPKKRNWPQLIGVDHHRRDAQPAGAQLLNGPRIDHQAFEALSCTAQLLRLVFDEHGAIRSYEMMPATVTDALFGAIAARDQHCRWPGCHKQPIHCDVHHVHFRENGGPNTPATAASLGHHHRVHEQQRRLTGTGEATTRTRVSSRGAAASPLRRSRTRKTTRTALAG